MRDDFVYVHPQYPIKVAASEDWGGLGPEKPLVPEMNGSPAFFPVRDLFGLRKAIVPLFHAEPESVLTGMGTAFAIDPWGRFLTADHVVDSVRRTFVSRQEGKVTFGFPEDERMVAMLGVDGVVFGTVDLPPDTLSVISEMVTPASMCDDPLAILRGASVQERPWDIALLQTATAPPGNRIKCVPLRRYPARPRIGDLIVALGYPEIATVRREAPRAALTLSEQMYAAYGVVTAVHDRGRDLSNPTPAFEVAAHWPSGMSGGPVFNAAGEVIGLVSRGMLAEENGGAGSGLACQLAAIPAAEWPASLDDANPAHRQGWAAIRTASGTIVAFDPNEARVRASAKAAGEDVEVRFCRRHLGIDIFSFTQ